MRRYIHVMLLVSLILSPIQVAQAEEINEDTDKRNIIDGVLDDKVFSAGGALLTEDGEFFEPVKESPVDIVENVGNTSSDVVVKGEMEIVSDAWSGKSVDNTYRFVGDGILKSESNVTYKVNKWFDILEAKENYLASRMKEIDKNGFKDLSFNGDLDTNIGDSFWVENVEDIRRRSGGTVTFRINDGSQNHFIILDGTNQNSMTWTLKAIDTYKDTVRHGLIRGSIAASYNVYSFYGTEPIKLKDALEEKSKGSYEIKNASNVKYEAQYFLNPLFGRMKYDMVISDKANLFAEAKKWDDYTWSIKIIHIAGNKLMFGLNNQYYTFLAEDNDYNKFLSSITNMSEVKGNGLKGYKPKYGKDITVKPKDIADAGLYMMGIKDLHKNGSTTDGTYQLNAKSFKANTTIKYLPKDNSIYTSQNGLFKNKGVITTQGFDLENLYLYKTTIGGVTVGGVFPTVYKEVIYNPADGKEYFTGRTINLLGDFHKSMKLDDSNVNKLSVKAPTMTDYGEKLKAYAFKQDSNYTNKDSHSALEANSNIINLQTIIRLPENKKVFGALMVRNNQYADDVELLKWLDTPEAKAMTDQGVEAEILKELIKGALKLEQPGLTYEEYLRLEEIREEMAGSFESNLVKAIVTVSAVFGYILCCYGVFMFLMYAIDLVNPFTDKSTLRMITFNRLYPVAHTEDIEVYRSSNASDSRITYVTWYHMFFICFCTISLGVMFILADPLITLIVKLFELGGFIVG